MSYADQVLSIYQVLVGLLDTDLALLTSKCQVLGVYGYGTSYIICVDTVDILQIKIIKPVTVRIDTVLAKFALGAENKGLDVFLTSINRHV